jgi:hypothetical protein
MVLHHKLSPCFNPIHLSIDCFFDSTDVDITVNDNANPVLANTFRFRAMEGDYNGVIVPVNMTQLKYCLPEECICPGACEDDQALFVGTVGDSKTRTPAPRTAYKIIKRDTNLQFGDVRIIYIDA